VMGIFPEGSRHGEGMGKKGAALIALRSGAAIVPAAIIGHYKLFRKMKVRYGQPMDLSAFINDSSSDVLERLTEAIMANIRELHRKG
jgi:1-acyl-sn-glycerol-3-phosphate acyltransferase